MRAEQLEYNARRESGYRERALRIYPGSAVVAPGSLSGKTCRNSPCTMSITIMTTTPMTAVTGNCYVFTATTKNTASTRTWCAMAAPGARR